MAPLSQDGLSEGAPRRKGPLHPPRTPRFMAEVPAEKVVTTFVFQLRSDPQFPPLPPLPRKRNDLHRPIEDRPQGPLSDVVTEAANQPAPEPPQPTPQMIEAAVFKEVQRERERLLRAVETLKAQGELLAEQARADAIEIAFQIAQKIVDTELRQSPEPLFALVRSALKQAGEARRLQVRVHPQDGELLRASTALLEKAAPAVAKLEIVDDSSLERGDCLVETDLGEIDGRLSTRFAELRRALDEAKQADEGAGAP
jgi:flagellar assembly protein FliH